ncbi:MAG: hypothetical protein COU51_00985 [Parcubacteria group bacterium CG10_big_fil_rev_8_21_14_0_10_36_14]|nr:MAG: hypothetical protein COU51_00985 [Parcubacteria group bacterium CG10_big_fil_rev_8_21_14_0_10_36_14]
MLKKTLKLIWRKKILSGICLVAIAGTSYFGYEKLGNQAETKYITSAVEKGMIIQSVSGSGKVSSLNQIDIKPKASGDITGVYVKEGQEVKKGTLLFSISSTDAQKSVTDAEISLDSAKIDLEEILEPVDQLTLMQAQNAYDQAVSSEKKAIEDLSSSYEDGLSSLTSIFFDLPEIMTDLYDVLFGYDFGTSQWNIDWYSDTTQNYGGEVLKYKQLAENNYKIAKNSYDKNFDNYKNISGYSETVKIDALTDETHATIKNISETIKSMTNLVNFTKDILEQNGATIPSALLSQQKTLQDYTLSVNKILGTPTSIKRTIQNAKDAIPKAKITLMEKEKALEDVKNGADNITIRLKTLAVQQKENALLSAKQNLAEYYPRAPFDGIIADLSVEKNNSFSSGNAGATITTKQKIAEISLNEIDVTDIKVGQKATLTFDAVEGLSITGEVVDVDSIGTISQNIVSYAVQIAFDIDDDRIKPGMSVSVSIITNSKQNILTVPLGAVKTQGQTSYVDILKDGEPQKTQVETGISNDTLIEITSGLNEGDMVVTQTISTGGTTPSASSNTGNKNFGGSGSFNAGSGAVMRIIQ